MDSSPGSAVSAPSAHNMALGAIIITSVVFVAFVLFAFVIFFVQYCINNSVPTRPRSRGGVLAASGARDKGVDPELLRSLPVTVYRAAAPEGPAAEDVGVECAVCLSELVDGEEARFLPGCDHGFHRQCVDTWLASHTTCPLCRVTVANPDASQTASTSLPAVPHEPANYAANLRASVPLGVSDQAALAAVTVTSGGGRPRPPALATAAVLVIDIPEPRSVATPRDAAKTPGSARLGSLKRLWSFGRQGPSGSTPSSSFFSSWAWGSGSGTADTERGIGNPCATPKAPV